eukprot:TRINITY_DN66793_c11_g3_i1.p1 TRINITY_DN66793_c11_g3~~TRINITY_DN66793_c11_g3_i1.p1  ORF type:complete len:264 (-),score=33.78 TRINITY_DN66793_c11_g3_i1:313-1104(-)
MVPGLSSISATEQHQSVVNLTRLIQKCEEQVKNIPTLNEDLLYIFICDAKNLLSSLQEDSSLIDTTTTFAKRLKQLETYVTRQHASKQQRTELFGSCKMNTTNVPPRTVEEAAERSLVESQPFPGTTSRCAVRQRGGGNTTNKTGKEKDKKEKGKTQNTNQQPDFVDETVEEQKVIEQLSGMVSTFREKAVVMGDQVRKDVMQMEGMEELMESNRNRLDTQQQRLDQQTSRNWWAMFYYMGALVASVIMFLGTCFMIYAFRKG